MVIYGRATEQIGEALSASEGVVWLCTDFDPPPHPSRRTA